MDKFASLSTFIRVVDMREEQCVRICGIEKSIRSRLDGIVVAYAYTIGGGAPKFDTAGYARTEADGGPALAGITQVPLVFVMKKITTPQ